jgi:hypothetical protein
MLKGYNYRSLKKWNVSEAEIDQVLASPESKALDYGTNRAGNNTALYVGHTDSGRLIEVGVEYVNKQEWVFHARDAIKHNRKLFEEE